MSKNSDTPSTSPKAPLSAEGQSKGTGIGGNA